MLLKRVKGGSKNNPIYYFQIAESYRSKEGPKHKTICTVGRVDDVIKNGTLKRFMESIARHLENVAPLYSICTGPLMSCLRRPRI